MPYRENMFKPGNYFHVYCRGNEKRNIFQSDDDYQRFIDKMSEYKTIHQVSIICYCLMPNHFHLILRQNSKQTLFLYMHRLKVSYSMYFNKHYKRVGHLFEGRFKAKLINKDAYLLHLSRYIHLNPVRILGVITGIENYFWSSYLEYSNRSNTKICDKDIILKQFKTTDNYMAYQDFVYSAISGDDFRRIKNIVIEKE